MKTVKEIATAALQRPAPRRWARRGLLALAGLLLFWLLAWAALPPLLKRQIEQQASAALGRQVSVQRVDFRPWTLELTVEGLSVANAAGDGEQFHLDRLYLDAELQSLLRLAPVIDAVTLEHPRVRLRHLGGGRYDIDDLLQRLLRPQEPPSALPRFALFNLALKRGELDFIDDSVGRTHALRAVELTVPFLSNLESRREVRTEPRLSYTLNGAAFDSRASSTPFAHNRHTDIALKVGQLDLTPYLPYWPARWPLQPRRGQLQIDLGLVFEQGPAADARPELKLSGGVIASDFAFEELQDNGQATPLLSWDRLQIGLAEVRPLRQQVRLAELRWEGPKFHLRRDADGRLNPQRILQGLSAQSDAAPATTPPPPPPPEPATRPAWQLTLDRFELKGGQLRWQDAASRPAADIALQELDLRASDIAWPGLKPVTLEGSAKMGDGTLNWSGQASDRLAQIKLSANGLQLALARPYLAQHLRPELAGSLSTEASLDWQAAQADGAPQLDLRATKLEVQSLALGPARQPLAGWARLALEQVDLKLATSSLNIGKLALERPRAQISRDARGRWMFEDWLAPSTGSAPAPGKGKPASAATPPWQLALGEVQLSQGQIAFSDETMAHPVRLQLDELELQTRNLRPLEPTQTAQPLSISLRLASDPGQPGGRLSYQGKLRLPAPATVAPSAKNALSAEGRLRLERLPLRPLEPYFGQTLNLDLIRADASFRGTVEASLPPGGLALKLRGDGAIDDLHADTLTPAERLLDWKTLGLHGVQLDVARGELKALQVSETGLSDYFARIIINADGSINLQKLLREPADASAATTSPASPAPTTPPAQAAQAAASASPPLIRFGPIAFVNGRVHFSDRFIKPNYSADLSELTGSLGAFDNQPSPAAAATLADLRLRGRAEGTATLDISGQLNPLARPLALDIKAAVRDLELPPLSPYTVKYAGYGIERGKLSMDVQYRIDPTGQLNATNQLTLNQLSFGERVEGSTAPNLPVRLAVALLTDHNGMINLNLPISGSINDPQFRIGAIVFRMIFNLIGKAVTAPFALIAQALGGQAEEFSQIVFAPGSAVLDATALKRLEQVAGVMSSRPGLQLTVVGESDLDSERNGYQRARLRDMVRAEKRRQLARGGAASDGATEVGATEYPDLLKQVYRRADIPKPRNLIGLPKDLPLADMEALLLASVAVDADLMRELALDRATAIRDQLITRQVPAERLFLGAPQTPSPGDSKDWHPQAELKLSLR